MSRANNNGIGISYQLYGKGEPLVLIHGWSCEGRYWDDFAYITQLSSRFTLIVPDLRGHGESDTPKDRDFTDEAFASDIVSVLDHIGLQSAHVFGYSLGGWAVFELAARFPSRIRKAIVGGAHPYDEDLSFLRSLTPSDILAGWGAANAPLSSEANARITSFDVQLLRDMAPDRIDKSQRLLVLPTPLLTFCGTHDPRFEEMKRFSADDSHCEFVALQGLDHLQTWVASERIVPLVTAFLHRGRMAMAEV